ncbi:hypothetical protein AVEN_9962-1 [Araneus ventricosus]|uniref:Uncharacterized protein n=1 Tax=Araneus ventricosus TaxID=182803 RepID=A0A4Y2FDP8_ARAVE|nr:hypothetical protein AVEN_9962-1 [Araneus ventricosus]
MNHRQKTRSNPELIPSSNIRTRPAGGRFTHIRYNVLSPQCQRIFSGIEFLAWCPSASKPRHHHYVTAAPPTCGKSSCWYVVKYRRVEFQLSCCSRHLTEISFKVSHVLTN